MIIDIREKDEVKIEKIEGAVNLPLNEKENLENFVKNTKTNIIIMCRSGKRADMFYSGLSDIDKEKCEVYKGGIIEYSKNNKTIKEDKKISLPIFRQVLITISLFLIMLSTIGLLLNSIGIYFIVFLMSLGILFAGVTGNCLMANILSRMWWNK